jgi:dynein heavy chain 2
MGNSAKKIAQFLVDLFNNLKAKFSADDHRHYLFTPRDVTALVFNLLRYDIPEATALIETLVYEASRIFRDRLVDKDSKLKFD